MTGVFWFIAGWISCAAAVALLLGAAVAEADRRDRAAKTKPAGVCDPETGAVWTEQRRLDVRA